MILVRIGSDYILNVWALKLVLVLVLFTDFW
jgi:hypothetical protein